MLRKHIPRVLESSTVLFSYDTTLLPLCRARSWFLCVVAAAYAAAPLSSSLLGASLEAPRAPGGLVGTIAQAHNIELVLYQP